MAKDVLESLMHHHKHHLVNRKRVEIKMKEKKLVKFVVIPRRQKLISPGACIYEKRRTMHEVYQPFRAR